MKNHGDSKNDIFNPRVSIVIPVYNGANYLREAIDSALSQTYQNREVLVVNDGSTDGGETEAIALSYGDRIRYVHQRNGGVAAALNTGIRTMDGQYFSWLSHDDVYCLRKTEIQVRMLTDTGRDAILYSDYEYIDHRGMKIGMRQIQPAAPSGFRLSLIVDDPVNGCTTLIPRSCFDECGLFDENLRTIQDYDMWFRLARRYRFVHIPQVLIRSRKHTAQGTYTISSHFLESENTYSRFIRELTDEEVRQMSPRPRAVFYLLLALRVKLRGCTSAADTALALSDSYARELQLPARFQRWVLRAFYRILNKKCKPGYWLARARQKLRS